MQRNRNLFYLLLVTLLSPIYGHSFAQSQSTKSTIKNPTLLQEIEAFSRIPSVVGREKQSRFFPPVGRASSRLAS